MHPAFDQIAPLHGIALAPDVVTATAVAAAAVVVIMNHIIPKEAVLAADATGTAPGGGLIPVTHPSHEHSADTTADHDPTEGIDLTTEAGLDPREDVIAADPILQTINIPGML